jgi:hypothetical protein
MEMSFGQNQAPIPFPKETFAKEKEEIEKLCTNDIVETQGL